MTIKKVDPSMFEDATPVAQQPLDKSLFEDSESLPDYANGLSPETAINQSPVEISDRAKLSVGNERGSLNYLKQRFEDATVIPGSSDFAVKKDGFWHRVDPEGWGDKDPWEVTKELLFKNNKAPLDRMVKEIASDVVDVAPIAAAVGANAAVAAATLGASIPAQVGAAGASAAAFAGAKTSLGRLAGTYEADAFEQAKDIGFETILNMAGASVLLGVKPGAKFIADKLPTVAKTFNAMAEAPKAVIRKTYGAMTVGENNWDTMLAETPAVQAAMRSAASATKNGGNYADELTTRNISSLKEIAGHAQDVLGKVWNTGVDDIVAKTGDDFISSVGKLTDDIYLDAVHGGLGRFVVAGKPVPVSELINGIPKGARFVLNSQKEIAMKQAATGAVDDMTNLAVNSDSYKQIVKFFGQLNSLSGRPSLTGKEGARQLINLKKAMSDITYTIKSQADDAGLNVVSRMMSKYHGIVDKSLSQQFEKSGLNAAYQALNTSYSGLKSQVAPLQSALQRSTKDNMAFQTLLNQIGAKDGKNVVQKLGIRSLLKAADDYGAPVANRIRELDKQIRVNQAAIAFNPLVKPNVLGQGSLTAGVGSLAMSPFGLGNPAFTGIALAGAAATSPRLAMYNMMAVKSLWKGKDFISGLTKEQLNKFVSDPKLVSSFVQGIVQSPLMAMDTEAKLLSGGGQ